MAKLSRAQIKKIRDIIENHMEVLMTILVGEGNPSPSLVKKLGLPKSVSDLITDSYKYGKLSVLQGKDLSKMSADDVEKLLRDLKMSKAQQYSIDYIKSKVSLNIDTLQQKLNTTILTAAINSDLNMWQSVAKVIPDAMEQHTSRSEVIRQLRETSGDWERDWHRVAHTEMWSAKCHGEAEAILNNESPFSREGGDTEVFMRPSPMACSSCKKLYLESNGITPKVFKLSELMSNGTNYGRKTADWKPVVPPMHPNCLCTMSVKPKNTKFDDNGNMVLDLP